MTVKVLKRKKKVSPEISTDIFVSPNCRIILST